MATRIATLTVCASMLLVISGDAFAQNGSAYPYPYHAHHNHNGYHVNRMGYGNYRPGPDGSFAGYPAGSDGAKIMRYQQEKKCQYAPESC